MAEDQEQPKGASPEAMERLRRERDELKTQVSQATAALDEANRRFKVQDYLASKNIPKATARAGVLVPHVMGLDDDAISSRLDELIDINGWTAQTDDDVAEAPVPQPQSGFVANPQAPGERPPVEQLDVSDIRQLVKREGLAAARAAQEEGRFALSDKNLKAQATLQP